ncbi:WD40 repeat-like protein [Hortaea werneckii]|nr:WD40 repeat-like protein [Hortaea werneckii]KAI7322570.1 WD40 repeat-like protein [Hortaea werneckii]
MPTTRHVAKEQASPAPPDAQRAFDFPSNNHLLITTPGSVQAWDAAGLHTIFKSSRSGIVAAREAKDGSGALAVADKHVVVLHDTKRGQDQSWGLNADEEEEVRHLEYSQDAKCLYLSTTLTNDVQRYSTERGRLLSPSQTHGSAPIALAVSSTGHLMVSASDGPPCIYLKHLAHNSSPILIEPRASDAPVCSAAFHPERPNVFLLGFRDGTLAAYDGTRVSRKQHSTLSNQEIVNDGEIARFVALHRVTAKAVPKTGITTRPASISGAAFLHGYKTRATSVGSDGRCRLVDFADGGIILRTWHAKAPLTSVSVFSIKPSKAAGDTHRYSAGPNQYTTGGPTSTDNLLAVGRADGKVHIYDSVGLLLAHTTVSTSGERVISLEWAKGPSPQSGLGSDGVRDLSDAPSVPIRSTTPKKQSSNPQSSVTVQPKSQARRSTVTPHRLGLPPDLRRSERKASTRKDRRFTVHPDEVEEGTVRHTPSKQRDHAMPVAAGNYLDLFSPVKVSNTVPDQPVEKSANSTPHRRPRISSKTFEKTQERETGGQTGDLSRSQNPEIRVSTATSTESEMRRQTAGKSPKTGQTSRPSVYTSPLKKRHISFQQAATPVRRQAGNPTSAPPQASDNARVLADLRKMSASTRKPQQGSVLAPFAGKRSTPDQTSTSKPKAPHHHWHHPPRLGPALQKVWHPGNVLEREVTWPTDSFQDQSLDEDEDDIWLTSGTDDNGKNLRRRRLATMQRPPARQTSRSRVDSKGTYSTTGKPPSPKTENPTQLPQSMDGSTESEAYRTARSHVSPHGDLIVDSSDVRQLFPRTSSLSPKRHPSSPRNRVGKPAAPTPTKHERALQEITSNTLTRRQQQQQQQKSPWKRAEAVAKRKEQSPVKHLPSDHHSPEKKNDSVLASAALVRSPPIHCFKCTDTGARVTDLEDEVARLKGEVLAMKAAMRRSGVPLPPTVRGMR